MTCFPVGKIRIRQSGWPLSGGNENGSQPGATIIYSDLKGNATSFGSTALTWKRVDRSRRTLFWEALECGKRKIGSPERQAAKPQAPVAEDKAGTAGEEACSVVGAATAHLRVAKLPGQGENRTCIVLIVFAFSIQSGTHCGVVLFNTLRGPGLCEQEIDVRGSERGAANRVQLPKIASKLTTRTLLLWPVGGACCKIALAYNTRSVCCVQIGTNNCAQLCGSPS